MVSSTFSRLAGFLGALCAISGSLAVPVAEPVETREVSRRSVPSAPHFVVYQYVYSFRHCSNTRLIYAYRDAWVDYETGPPDASVVSGYNVLYVLVADNGSVVITHIAS